MGSAAAGDGDHRPPLGVAVGEGARAVHRALHKSRGRLRNLSVRERLELRKLAHKLDVRGMGSELVALGRGKHRRRARAQAPLIADGRRPRQALHARAARPRRASCRAPHGPEVPLVPAEAVPAAELVSGDEGEADYDLESTKGLISDAVHSGDGALGEALRPLFIDYLRKHVRRIAGWRLR